VAEKKAGVVPGAVQFLQSARFHGVHRVYITNRVCNPSNPDDPTYAVLTQHGLIAQSDRLMCKSRAEDSSDKSVRRAEAAREFRILLLVGDDLGDFLSAPRISIARDEVLERHARWFGERWFILPNPAYGSWERVFANSEAKRAALE
jgi:acid phosphatase